MPIIYLSPSTQENNLYVTGGSEEEWMNRLADAMIPGIAVGVVGMVMAIVNYPIYKKILNARKKKYAPKILELSEKLMKGE